MVEALQDAMPLDRVLVEIEDGLWLLPTRTSGFNPVSLLAGNRTPGLMADLRDRFDLVLIDSPPLAGLADGLVLGSMSDAVVLVVRAGVTKPADLTAAVRSFLEQNNTPIAGTVVFEERAHHRSARGRRARTLDGRALSPADEQDVGRPDIRRHSAEPAGRTWKD